MGDYLICNNCKYKAYFKNSYPCASCKHSNYYKYFTPAVNEYIGQCPSCGTPFIEGDIKMKRDVKGPSSVMTCICHNSSCRQVSVYKIGTYVKKEKRNKKTGGK